MIKFENTEVVGWEAAIRGMRNPMNSWEMSDSVVCDVDTYGNCRHCAAEPKDTLICTRVDGQFAIGPNDLSLMKKLRNAGTDHRKFMRMIVVYVDITAPLYWWKEFDTYKVGTVANSCSTMHKIAAKEFTLEDFSHEHLFYDKDDPMNICYHYENALKHTVQALNDAREHYLACSILLNSSESYGINPEQTRKETKERQKRYWHQMIQLLPSSYNQKRTVMMSYEVLANIYKSRKNHKLDEWSESTGPVEDLVYGPSLCDWIKTLPYSELITG